MPKLKEPAEALLLAANAHLRDENKRLREELRGLLGVARCRGSKYHMALSRTEYAELVRLAGIEE